MSNTGIYTITSPTNKVYVGQSSSMIKRFCSYKNLLCKDQPRIYNSLKKHGWLAHKFEVVLELRDDISQATLDCWEEYFMDLYKGKGYELMNLKEAGSHGKHSEETKKKMSDTRKERLVDGSIITTKNPMQGRKHTEESKQKMSIAKGGKKPKPSPKSKKGVNSYRFKGYVTVYKDGVKIGVFEGVRGVAEYLNTSYSNVRDTLNSKQKSARGCTFTREPLQK